MEKLIPVIRQERAAALTVVIVIAIVCSILAWGVLYAAIANARGAQFHRKWMKARYAAEAGLVWAMQRLWDNPAWTPPAALPTLTVDGIPVDITYAPCPTPPCPVQATARN